jgi:hypothetical protein
MGGCTVGNLDSHFRVAPDTGTTPVNEKPDPFWCWSCGDYGIVELFHPSTDALIGHRKCLWCPPLTKGIYMKPLKLWEGHWKLTSEEKAELPPF